MDKYSVFSLKVDASEGKIAFGVANGESASITVLAQNLLGVSFETFKDNRCSYDVDGNISHANMCMCDTDSDEEITSTIGLGAGLYLGLGLHLEIGWDMIEIFEKLNKIWQ